ncbi:DUF937 domain-containing protein [Alcaligenaceae bacterium]|nr:DUF937 domain-containing protein [Alcaligenaceae bacterium]
MEISEFLTQSGAVSAMARDLGVTEDEASRGAGALLPALMGGFRKQSQTQGIAGLGGLLEQFGGSALLDNVLGDQSTDVDRGNNVLGQVFGSPDVSRTVAQDASSKSGLSSDLLKKMLPILAMLVTGFLARQKNGEAAVDGVHAGGGGLGGMLGGLLGGKGATAGGLGGLASLLDANGDGNVLDDIMRMAGKTPR